MVHEFTHAFIAHRLCLILQVDYQETPCFSNDNNVDPETVRMAIVSWCRAAIWILQLKLQRSHDSCDAPVFFLNSVPVFVRWGLPIPIVVGEPTMYHESQQRFVRPIHNQWSLAPPMTPDLRGVGLTHESRPKKCHIHIVTEVRNIHSVTANQTGKHKNNKSLIRSLVFLPLRSPVFLPFEHWFPYDVLSYSLISSS